MVSKRVEWIDLIKVITMLLVVIGHCDYYDATTSFGGTQYLDTDISGSFVSEMVSFLTRFIYSFHMPLFMAVSGACYAITRKPNEEFGVFVSKKAKRLLLPFFLVTTLVSIPCKYISDYYHSSSHLIWDIFMGQYLLLGNSHLWFIVCLFLIFIVAYWIERIQIRKNMYFVGALLLISWVGYHFSYTGIFSSVLIYIFYFYIGYITVGYFSSKEKTIRFIVFSWIIFLLIYGIYYQYDFYASRLLRIVNYPLRTFFAFCGIYNMIFTCKALGSQKNNLSSSKIYSYLKNNSYDLYLYSDPFNYLLIPILVYYLGDTILTTNIGALTAFIVRLFGTMFLAMLLIYIIKRFKSIVGQNKIE